MDCDENGGHDREAERNCEGQRVRVDYQVLQVFEQINVVQDHQRYSNELNPSFGHFTEFLIREKGSDN